MVEKRHMPVGQLCVEQGDEGHDGRDYPARRGGARAGPLPDHSRSWFPGRRQRLRPPDLKHVVLEQTSRIYVL